MRDVRILPNFNASYLPMMPDGSVMLVDNVWYDCVGKGGGSVYACNCLICALC